MPNKHPLESDVMTTYEAVRVLGVTHVSVCRYAKDGTLKVVGRGPQFGNKPAQWLLDRRDVYAFAAEREAIAKRAARRKQSA